MKPVLVVSGSFAYGFTLTGPFKYDHQAIDWAERCIGDDDGDAWRLIELDERAPDNFATGNIMMLLGDPIRGFSVTGTFDTVGTALAWTQTRDDFLRGRNYWATTLEVPE